MTDEILFDLRGATLTVTFNRPEQRNRMTLNMANALQNRFKTITTDRGIRLVVLRGQGEHFMDGLDLGLYHGDLTVVQDKSNQLIQALNAAVREMYAMDKPILAVARGRVSGVGLSLMLASDLTIAARSANFNCGFVSYAGAPEGGASFGLTRKLGMAKACELLMLDSTFTATQADEWHLINRVVDDAELDAQAQSWAEQLAAGPTRSYAAAKKLTAQAFEHDLHTHLGLEHVFWGGCSKTFDFREGVKAIAQSRSAKFTGA